MYVALNKTVRRYFWRHSAKFPPLLHHHLVYRHYTLSNSIMCSDSYPIPILSLFFLYHHYIPYFLIQRIFCFIVSFIFLLHACMYSHQVYNSNDVFGRLVLGQGVQALPLLQAFTEIFHEDQPSPLILLIDISSHLVTVP